MSPHMCKDASQSPNYDPEQDAQELLAVNDALEKRVERLADGPMKTKLKAVLAELRIHVSRLRPLQDRGN
jgi:hypothetical protein